MQENDRSTYLMLLRQRDKTIDGLKSDLQLAQVANKALLDRIVNLKQFFSNRN